ncbi:uncharacterized protein LOC127000964 [Eriocheir sinensis]|uniref:uncharacterized protein LOC127000964 n=1 Tax=Eriocheir sinensis TaxID=95602 RepID=UPI0021C9D7E4|nr:uncharacterized protein LOC127000964 [Eriocheir sinensis]
MAIAAAAVASREPQEGAKSTEQGNKVAREARQSSSRHVYLQGQGKVNSKKRSTNTLGFGVDLERLQQKETQKSRSGQTRDGEWLRHWFNLSGPSTCSDFATQRGGGQHVIAYSYYNTNATISKASTNYKKYFASLHKRARRIAKVYPGYLMRVYHNVTTDDTTAMTFLCKLLCTHAHLDLCDVTKLPNLGNLVQRGVIGRAWRFAVLGDPTVDLFLSRDSDSWVLDREVDAVHEWLASGRAFHVMRDHPNHKAVMLAGLWGGRNTWLEGLSKIRDTMFDQPMSLHRNHDQHLLANHLWPVIQNDTLQHDSFNCQDPTHLGANPFPSMRVGDLYCGCGPYKTRERWRVSRTRCPKVCRPLKHPSWTRC